jgi:hypothetical protein
VFRRADRIDFPLGYCSETMAIRETNNSIMKRHLCAKAIQSIANTVLLQIRRRLHPRSRDSRPSCGGTSTKDAGRVHLSFSDVAPALWRQGDRANVYTAGMAKKAEQPTKNAKVPKMGTLGNTPADDVEHLQDRQ